MKKLTAGNKQAFTLVELIVVITILAILGTIAFISLEGYSKNSRDGVRIADINSARKSLELYITEKGTYPIPDNESNITYSGGIAWIEGTIGDGVIRNLDKINKKLLDPLTGNEYTYSITASKTEYQIGAISEGGTIGYKLPINQTHAATSKKGTAMIRGTYNERFLKVQSGTINRILALPSIIAIDITQTDVQTILDNSKLVYNNYQNIPHSYNNAGYTMTGGFNYTNTNPQIYSGSLKSLTESNQSKLDFITKLKEAYDGTILQGEPNYKDIVATDLATNSTGAINAVISFINLNVGGLKVSNTIIPILTTNGTSESQQVQFLSNCTESGEIYYADNNGNKLATVTNTGSATWVSGKEEGDLTCEGHIIVCGGTNSGYTLQACNAGATTLYTNQTTGSTTERSTVVDAWAGYLYQWGRNKGFTGPVTQQSTRIVNASYNPSNDTYGFVWNSNLSFSSYRYDWIVNQDDNLWGNTTGGSIARQGPCPTNYHVPTRSEWTSIHTVGGWGTGTNLLNTLRLPMAGKRTRNGGYMDSQGINGYYWASSPNGTYGSILFFGSADIYTILGGYRANGYSVRCLKN